jgi:hypothetical protein
LIDGGGTACTPNPHETVGAKIALTVTWPTTLANAGCDDKSTPPCKGTINIWLLTQYNIDSMGKVTGTTATCGNQTPPIPLTMTGTQSEGLDPSKTTAVVDVGFDPTVWANILANPKKAPTQTTGALGGWAIGSSMQINPTNSVYGLSDTSMYASATATWPGSEMDIAATDITDDDNDGFPGITGTPSTMNGDVLPSTAAQLSPPYAAQADKLFLTLRTELSLYGTSSSCTDISGTVGVQQLNNHVIGCELANDGGLCTQPQWDFIDSNTTVYLGPGVVVPPGMMAASFAPSGISGTFNAKILSTDVDGGGIQCSDVLAAFP